MAEVRIDTIIQDRQYDALSFSSEEDIYDLLWHYDIVKEDAEDGVLEAMVVIMDLERLIYDEKGHCLVRFVEDYISIQTDGLSADLGLINKEPLEILSIRKGIDIKTCETKLQEDVEKIIEINNIRWKKSVEKKYDRVEKERKNTHSTIVNHKDIPQEMWDLDRKLKYQKFEGRVRFEGEFPDDLLNLIETQKKNRAKLSALGKILNRNRDEAKEMSLRIRYDKTITEDVQELKDHYNIPYKTNFITPTQNNTGNYSYIEWSDDPKQDELLDTDNELQVEAWQIHKIRKVARKVLTNRQLLRFELYFFEGMLQSEIAYLVRDTQGHVSRDLSTCIEKIKRFLEKE